MKSKKSIVSIFLMITILSSLSPVFATPARAQWIVIDPTNAAINAITAANTTAIGPVKEFGLDALAWMIAKLIVQRITASTVSWINSGFKGKPAFVTDPEAYFGDIADKVAGNFITKNTNLGFLCAPISAKIRLALISNYTRDQDPTKWKCTLTQIGQNMEDFMADFSNGGWDNFFEISQRQQNSPIGAYVMAENAMNLQITTKQGTAQSQLNWGQGFMSYQKCNGKEDADGFCNGSLETVTPGSVIANQLNKNLGAGMDSLVTADEMNEIVSALFGQLINHVIGGIGNGLRGLSSPSSTGENTFTDQLGNSEASTTVDYFKNKQDTSTLDIPIQNPYPNQDQALKPLDTDCSGIDTATLYSDAQQIVNQSGIPFDEALRNLDCPPLGINP